LQNIIINITSILGIGAVILICITLLGLTIGQAKDDNFVKLYPPTIGIFLIVLGGIKLIEIKKEISNFQTSDYETIVAENLTPFGKVNLPLEDIKPKNNNTPIKNNEPNLNATSGEQVYSDACVICHGAGIGGAPITGDKNSWLTRIAQGNDILYEHAILGYQGSAGYMPAKGARMDLSDEQVIAAVDYMTEKIKN